MPRVELPAPTFRDGKAGRTPRRYEIVYATDNPVGLLGARLEAPAPTLPGPPLTFLRRWRLPPGLLPLFDSQVRALPSASAEPETLVRGPADLFGAAALLRPLALEDWETRQREQLKAAARSLPAGAAREITLGEALERLGCDAASEHDPLVIDTLALEEAGLTQQTPLLAPARDEAPFWVALGLVHVPCRTAPLLTTQRRCDAWQAAGHDAGTVPPSVEAAVREAAANGYDTSGRFLWSVAWARRRSPDGRWTAGPGVFDAGVPGWTEWEPVGGAGAETGLTVVRRPPVRAAGTALAVLLLVGLWSVRHQNVRRRLALLLAGVAAAIAGLLWLPTPLHGLALGPLVAGGGLGLAWYLWSVARSAVPQAAPSSRPSARGASSAAVLALLAAGAFLATRAAPPAPSRSTVLIVPGPAEAPQQATVLASHDLLKQIDALASAGAPRRRPRRRRLRRQGRGRRRRVRGPPADPELRGRARRPDSSLHRRPSPGRRTPRRRRAYLKTAPPGQAGFVLRIEKPGPHVLVLRFRAAVTANGSERAVRFRARASRRVSSRWPCRPRRPSSRPWCARAPDSRRSAGRDAAGSLYRRAGPGRRAAGLPMAPGGGSVATPPLAGPGGLPLDAGSRRGQPAGRPRLPGYPGAPRN